VSKSSAVADPTRAHMPLATGIPRDPGFEMRSARRHIHSLDLALLQNTERTEKRQKNAAFLVSYRAESLVIIRILRVRMFIKFILDD
jgi:hypothetical protein